MTLLAAYDALYACWRQQIARYLRLRERGAIRRQALHVVREVMPACFARRAFRGM